MLVVANIVLLTVCVIAGMYIGSAIQVNRGEIDDSMGAIVGGVLGLIVAYPIIASWSGLG